MPLDPNTALRALHIVSGVLWAGFANFMAFVVFPAAKADGPAGMKFVGGMVKRSNLTVVMSVLGILTVVPGAIMLRLSGLDQAFGTSAYATVITLGALFGIVGLLAGGFVVRPAAGRMSALAAQAAKGKPGPELQADIAATQGKMRMGLHMVAGMTLLTVLLMASARLF